jgi:hypothetical protein
LGLELCIGNCDRADGRYRTTAGLYNPSRPVHAREYAQYGELGFMRRRMNEAIGWISANPRQFVILCARRARLIWFAPPGDWSENSSMGRLKSYTNAAISALALAMLVRLFAIRSPVRWSTAGAIVGFAGVYVVTHVIQRYVYPLFWLNVLLAATFVDSMFLARNFDQEVDVRTPHPDATPGP